jgi:hypothetical protein
MIDSIKVADSQPGDIKSIIEASEQGPSDDSLAVISADVIGVAKRRLIPIALQTLEDKMLNGKKDNDQINAANSVLDRFGYASRSGGQGTLVAVPVPLEYMKTMLEGLKAFGKDEAIEVEAVGQLTNDSKRVDQS